jgi:LacI family transcriptional regulator
VTLATQKDVAERARVSFITVSRVINNKGNVRAETKERVLEAIRELNYYPNAFGQGLTANRVRTVAVVAPVPSHVSVEGTSYYRRLLIGIEEYCINSGYDLLLSADRGTDAEFDFLRPFYERKADGLILMGVNPNNVHFPRGDRRKGSLRRNRRSDRPHVGELR